MAPKKRGRIYGIGSLQHEASTFTPIEEPMYVKSLREELRVYKQQSNTVGILLNYMKDKDPIFADLLRSQMSGNETTSSSSSV